MHRRHLNLVAGQSYRSSADLQSLPGAEPTLKRHSTMNKALVLLVALFSSSTHAEPVGRAELQIAEPWIALTSYVSELKFDNGQHVLPVQTKVFYVPGPSGVPKALLVVTSTESRLSGKVRWVSEICPEPRPKYFTQDYGSNKQSRVRECLVVNSAFAPFAFFHPESEVLKAIDEKGIKLLKAGYSFRSVYGVDGGALLRVNLVTSRAFKGERATPEADQLHDVPPDLIAWGEALHRAVRKSVSSLGGELTLPQIALSE